MSLKAFIADTLITDAQVLKNRALLTEHGKTKAFCALSEIPQHTQRIDLGGLTLAPALVDAQVNGGGGILFNDTLNLEGLKHIAAAHNRSGTSAFLPTLITDDMAAIPKAIDCVRRFRQENSNHSRIIGLHLEGPFLNPSRSGIHEKNLIQKADATFLQGINCEGLGVLLITLAPEIFEKGDLKKLILSGALLAAGHSAADQDALLQAKAEGLTGITHLFNAMGGMSAREPGLSGRALDDDSLWCSIIADGAHVAPAMLRLADKAKPAGKLFFVSDAMPPAGMKEPTEFILQGKRIFVGNGRCTDENDHLAGSAKTLFECVRYAVQSAGFPLEKALAMASIYPAQFLNADKDHGSLTPGHHADFIAFDASLNIQKIVMGGDVLAP